MQAILTDPALQASVVPFVAALVLTLLLRLAGAAGPALAGAAIGCGVVATYLVILGLPPLLPVTATHKIGAIVVAGTVAGVGLDLGVRNRSTRVTAVLLLTGLALVYVGWRGFYGMDKLEVTIVAACWAAAVLALPRLVADADEATDSAAILLVAGVALALVALYGAVASLGQLAGGVAAAAGGFALVNWLVPRQPFGAAAVLGGGAALFALATAMALFSDADPIALALIVPAFFCPARGDAPAAGQWRSQPGRAARCRRRHRRDPGHRRRRRRCADERHAAALRHLGHYRLNGAGTGPHPRPATPRLQPMGGRAGGCGPATQAGLKTP